MASMMGRTSSRPKALIARKTIVAPFDGVLGIRQVDVGQYLNVGAPIVQLQSADPIYADFSLPQQSLDRVPVSLAGCICQTSIAGCERQTRGQRQPDQAPGKHPVPP